jgi:sigma-54-like protein
VYHRKHVTDDVKHQIKLSQQLVMTPQLQMAIQMLSTPSAELGTLIASVKGLAQGSDGDDPLLVADDDNPLTFVDRPGNLAIADADVWIAGNPPIARAIRGALPAVHLLPDLGAEEQRQAR